MRRISVRFLLFYVSLCPAVFAEGQRGRLEEQILLPDLKLKVFEKMKERENDVVQDFRWSEADGSFQKPLAIKHQPTEDFNIYLTISHLLTPSINTSMEISLNNRGIVNLRHVIALRKKEKE